ncbi:MAG: SDR family NAD(P)-dependent oxidoreductase, partial [Anaerolineales bacterium]|nr:SDR family NAD(P)-dependent oxidoreductase [Anaerolineales bacterium]
MDKLFSLSGKVALITGGTGVLGAALGQGMAQAGATVGLLGRRTQHAQDLAEQINTAGGKAFPLTADVLDKKSLLAARAQVLAQHGRIDILVNCAGGNRPGATIAGDVTFFGMAR